MQTFLFLYFLTVLNGGTVVLCRAVLRDLPRIGAALSPSQHQTTFWSNLARADLDRRHSHGIEAAGRV